MKRLNVILLITLLFVTMWSVGPVYADGPDAVYILDNEGFATYASSGNGSLVDPYVIQDKYIESFGGYGMYIANTTAYCIFNNVTVVGESPGYGIYLSNVSNVNFTVGYIYNQRNGILVDNCSNIFIDDFVIDEAGDYGVRIDVSDNIAIMNSNFSNTGDGIQLWNSFRIGIWNNTFVGTGISFYGTCQVSTGVQVTGNIVNNRPLGYLYNTHDRHIDISGYGQVILVNSVNVTLHNADISGTNIGIQFIFCQNSIVEHSNISNNYNGIVLYESSYCGIFRNNITGNVNGILGDFAIGTIINENNIMYNTQFGLWAYYGCSSSAIYLNNFIGNTVNARDDGGIEDSNLIWAGIRFTNSMSEWPLANVSVTLEQGTRTYTGYSNENGLFKVPLPNTGPYNVTIEKFRYQTKNILNYDKIQYGINLFEIGLDKADLGPGTGYVLARFMDGEIPVVGASVRVYSNLDGAYYFHSEYTSAVSPEGWVNITGLYYDTYTIDIDHIDYERRIISQTIVSDGLAGTYNNIQLTAYPSDAFIYGTVIDESNITLLEDANVTMYNEYRTPITAFTDSDGFFNITDIPFGEYNVEVSKTGYKTFYHDYIINTGGGQSVNPVTLTLYPIDYVPEEPLDGVVNNWDNEVVGNYWDDYNDLEVILAEESTYQILGDNIDNPVDEYPSITPFIFTEDDDLVYTTTVVSTTTFDGGTISETSEIPEEYYINLPLIMVGLSLGITGMVVLLFGLIKKEERN